MKEKIQNDKFDEYKFQISAEGEKRERDVKEFINQMKEDFI